jgi:hypothetical protein
MLFAVTPWSDRHSSLLNSIIRIVEANDTLSRHLIKEIVTELERNERVWITKRSQFRMVKAMRRITAVLTRDEPSIFPLFHALENLITSAPIARSELDRYFVFQLLYLLMDFTRSAYKRDLLSEYVIDKLFNLLRRIEGIAQDVSEQDEEVHERIQAATLDLCATLAALQQQGKTFLEERELRAEIRRYAYEIYTQNIKRQSWLPSKSYDIVLSMLPQTCHRPIFASTTIIRARPTDIESDEEPGEL